MQLSKFSDYSFRALIYLAKNNDKLTTIEQMANELKISQNHLKKIIHKLSKGNFIESFKGRDGGIKIVKNPQDIRLSDVLLYTEVNTDFVECLKHNIEHTDCPYHDVCNLKSIIHRAKDAFIHEFQKYSLKDLL
ncbi:Rrf2 family transcriptional regulator [Helicobacter didelphidarum]|uniref:Rrf2 family transcriptional regulator n=1 Tax=Helicobacter didelphidarum TaxID=2040648 RepID=A0A3D8IL88_9HELI|nr:Rrf2 family transcriptional regulator [Helicobacter didelphidarum]RDU65883.1 Rrf2 family transcriptional regulator [Helicobacter didelphidarum]